MAGFPSVHAPGYAQCYDFDHIFSVNKKHSISGVRFKAKILAEIGLPPDFNVEPDPIPPVGS